MYVDVRELRDFYLSPQGRVVRRLVSSQIRAIWPCADGRRLCGVGHTTPYFRPYLGEAERLFALMPAAAGALHWPPEGPNMTALAFETELPLPDMSIDLLLMAHVLEMTESPQALLREAWRVLVPGGRMLVLVPHRSGLWANAEATPFGHGRPFSRGQLTKLAREALFAPLGVSSLLYVPPTTLRIVLGSANGWERVGRKLWPGFPGLIALEAEKRMMQGILPVRRRRMATRFVPALNPLQVHPGRTSLSDATGTRPARRTCSTATRAR